MNDPKKVFLASILAVLLAQTGLAWGGSGVSETTSTLPSNIPPEYQDAISKVLPGYEILRNEDLLQDENQLKNFLSPDEIAVRKKRQSLGFIEGRFNDDRFMDFAAWVVNRSIKQECPKPRSSQRGSWFAWVPTQPESTSAKSCLLCGTLSVCPIGPIYC
jgi:hypothetical protein